MLEYNLYQIVFYGKVLILIASRMIKVLTNPNVITAPTKALNLAHQQVCEPSPRRRLLPLWDPD
jgi:hypothetical protein